MCACVFSAMYVYVISIRSYVSIPMKTTIRWFSYFREAINNYQNNLKKIPPTLHPSIHPSSHPPPTPSSHPSRPYSSPRSHPSSSSSSLLSSNKYPSSTQISSVSKNSLHRLLMFFLLFDYYFLWVLRVI